VIPHPSRHTERPQHPWSQGQPGAADALEDSPRVQRQLLCRLHVSGPAAIAFRASQTQGMSGALDVCTPGPPPAGNSVRTHLPGVLCMCWRHCTLRVPRAACYTPCLVWMLPMACQRVPSRCAGGSGEGRALPHPPGAEAWHPAQQPAARQRHPAGEHTIQRHPKPQPKLTAGQVCISVV
jgi:hypothetical protein